MKRKLNIKKLIICIVVLISIMIMPTFSRFVYNNARDIYLKSQNFSFSSNLLTNMGKTYKYSNWSGVDDYEINLQLYSYENELSLFTYEGNGLEYNLTCEVEDSTKATAHLGTSAGIATETSYIPNATNIKDLKIYIKPTENLQEGDTVKVKVTANTTKPYKKQISATFNIDVTDQSVTYRVEDDLSSIYATLKLVNPKNESRLVTLTFDPNIAVIDETNDCYKNRISQTSENIDGVEYVNSIAFIMDPEDSNSIRFYKKDVNVDYTYPNGESTSSLITTIQDDNPVTIQTLTAEDYGGYVTNYSASNGANVGWRIFHSDGENIYLIADDYIENTYKPAGKNGTTYSSSSGAYGANLAAYVDYAGTADWDRAVADKWLSQYTYTSEYDNAKATAYLIDTNVWSGFKDRTGYAEYAIGGPTLELFVASYNESHDIDIDITVKNEGGYSMKWSTDTDYRSSVLQGMDTTEDLYIKNHLDVVGTVLATPSSSAPTRCPSVGMCCVRCPTAAP